MSEGSEADFSFLIPLFERRNEDGSPRYTPQEIDDLVCAVLLSGGFEPDELPPRLKLVLIDFVQRIELPADALGPEMGDHIQRYYEQNPLNPELKVEFERNFREAQVIGAQTSEQAQKLLHQAKAQYEARAEPKEDEVPSGPLSYFNAHQKLKK